MSWMRSLIQEHTYCGLAIGYQCIVSGFPHYEFSGISRRVCTGDYEGVMLDQIYITCSDKSHELLN